MSTAAQDRQIKPIYDAIDRGQHKLAIQTCAKILKKQPKFELVKALRSLALVRMGKLEEGIVGCDEILATNPTDELVLGAMTHVLRGLNRHDDMVVMFEGAFKRQPQNEEYGAQAFMANVRIGNWKAAQQLANKLHKAFREDRFLYWNVMCIILQASELSTPPETQPILLKLALRLIATCPLPSSITPDRFFLHLTLLRDSEQYNEALQLLETDASRTLCDTSLALEDLRHTIAMAAGQQASEYQLAKSKLEEKRDRNWLTFMKFINCTLDRIKEEDVLIQSRRTLERLAQEDGTSERGSHLASLELEKRVREAHPDAPQVSFVSLLKNYFATLGDKASCYEDLKQFTALEGDERAQWKAFLEEQDFSNASSSNLELSRQINVFKLQRWDLTIDDMTVGSEQARADRYLHAYMDALPLGKDLPPTELQPADDLATLTGLAYISLYIIAQSQSYLSCAVSILEFALVRSPQAFQHRLLLIRLYRLMGAPSLALDHYHKLNVKQVQQDSMAHFVLSRCSTFNLGGIGDLTYLQECLESSQIYTNNTTETPDMVIKAFQYEKYTQIPEFIEFEDRLDNSIQRDLTKMEHVRMRLTHEPATVETVDTELFELKFLFEKGSLAQFDNRDFTVIPDYQPRGQSIDIQTAMGGNSPGPMWLQAWMKVYVLVLQLASDMDPAMDGNIILGDKLKLITAPGQVREPLDVRIRSLSEEEQKELTPDEQLTRSFVMSLATWLEPHHEYSRPPPKPLQDISSPLSASQSVNGKTVIPPSVQQNKPSEKQASLEPPPHVDIPEEVARYFQRVEVSFKEALEKDLPWRSLHIASLTQEAAILFNIVVARFRLGGGSKMKKSDPVMHSIKTIREKLLALLRTLNNQLLKLGEAEATVDGRRAFVEECKPIRVVPEITHDFTLDVAKKITDARKKVREGLAKGLDRFCKGQGQGLNLTSPPS